VECVLGRLTPATASPRGASLRLQTLSQPRSSGIRQCSSSVVEVPAVKAGEGPHCRRKSLSGICEDIKAAGPVRARCRRANHSVRTDSILRARRGSPPSRRSSRSKSSTPDARSSAVRGASWATPDRANHRESPARQELNARSTRSSTRTTGIAPTPDDGLLQTSGSRRDVRVEEDKGAWRSDRGREGR
jgi:hypothetical protein